MAETGNPRDSSGRTQIIIALIGLAGVVATALITNWNNIPSRKSSPTPSKAASPAPAPNFGRKSERTVHSSGRLTVRGTYTCDLDEGKESPSGADFQWRQQNSVVRSIAPMNGAMFFVVGQKEFESVRWSDMERFPYSAAPIPGNANRSQIPPGTIVAYKTSEGRLGKFIVDGLGSDLSIRWRTFD
jgi:hypothetical protein